MTNKMKNHKITKLGGLNNSNYLLEYENNKYVLRIPSKDNKNNFSEENFVLIFANLNKLSPPIIYHNKDNGILISKFLEDSKVNMSTFTSLEFLEKLSINLKKLHILKCEHIFNPFEHIRKNFNILKSKNFNFHEDIDLVLNKLNILEEKLSKNMTLGLCHNDLNSSNVLYHNKNVLFIDFEFSAMCDIFFDLATVSWMLDEKKRYFLIKSYFGYYSYELMEKLENYLFVVKLWNASWSFLKSLNTNSTYDYKLGGNMIIDDLLSTL
ncbi:phosphotransferase [Clostridium perfringens]